MTFAFSSDPAEQPALRPAVRRSAQEAAERGDHLRLMEMAAAMAALQDQALELRTLERRRMKRTIVAAIALLALVGAAAYGYGLLKADMLAEQKAVVAAAEIVAKEKAAEEARNNKGIRIIPSTDPDVLAVQQRAAKGEAKAQFDLAMRYEQGRGVGIDKPLAQSLLQNAAAGGHAPAMMELGSAYLTGRFGKPDKYAALRWLEAAASAGNAIAAFKLGALYESGLDGAPDTAMALGWYQRAAGLGSDPALLAIARLAPKRPPIGESEVKRIQVALRQMGYNIGMADGRTGRQTMDAIKAYQEHIGMMTDGRPSYFLLEKLEEERTMQGG